jgi:hypothetical protein
MEQFGGPGSFGLNFSCGILIGMDSGMLFEFTFNWRILIAMTE